MEDLPIEEETTVIVRKTSKYHKEIIENYKKFFSEDSKEIFKAVQKIRMILSGGKKKKKNFIYIKHNFEIVIYQLMKLLIVDVFLYL